MLKSCLPYLGSPDCVDDHDHHHHNNNHHNHVPKTKELEEPGHAAGGNNNNLNTNNFPSSFESSKSKHIFVRVVHAGGKVDHYPNAVLAAKLLETLPGKWLARPEVFKHPHQSIIYPEDYLLPGHKYFVIPLSTIDKLMRKHNNIRFVIPPNNINGINQQMDLSSEANIDHDVHILQPMDDEDFSFCSARDFYANEHKRSTSSTMNGSSGGSRKPRILLPVAKPKPKPKPKAKPKPCSAYSWEPGLTSIQELSP